MNNYPALILSQKNPECQTNPPLPISSLGTDLTTADQTNLPAGSALLTDTLDGSGNGSSVLNDKGITHIIHAAPKPRSSFSSDQDFINCVVKAVQNSIILADRYQFEKLAIPLVGGEIFAGSCSKDKLAEGIIAGSLSQLETCSKLKKIIFIEFNNSLFSEAFSKISEDYSEKAEVKQGDIRDKNLHGASVIVNAANTYVGFGGGISKAISQQVGDSGKIDEKARELIKEYYQLIKKEKPEEKVIQPLSPLKENKFKKYGWYAVYGVAIIAVLWLIWLIVRKFLK